MLFILYSCSIFFFFRGLAKKKNSAHIKLESESKKLQFTLHTSKIKTKGDLQTQLKLKGKSREIACDVKDQRRTETGEEEEQSKNGCKEFKNIKVKRRSTEAVK